MKILTCLGTDDYKPVTYRWENREYPTELFPEALGRWFGDGDMLVLLTPEVRVHENWERLQKRLESRKGGPPKEVPIPQGKSEEELWEIFEELTKHLGTKEDVLFDVTHAFRSIPVLTLLAVAYLRTAREVNLKHLLYGAYEARDKGTGRAPVFDLSPFLTLLEWVTATDKFIETGDARGLARLLDAAHRLPWKQATGQSRDDLPRVLQGLGGTLKALSQALEVIRPQEIPQAASKLASGLVAAAAEAARWAKPFTVLLERSQTAYADIAADDLAAQRRLVRWYAEHGHSAQAILLGREWLVSWGCQQLGKDLIADRQAVENAINEAVRRWRGEAPSDDPPLLQPLLAVPAVDELYPLWGPASDLRNDLAHCGFRQTPSKASALVKAAERLAVDLDRLPL